MGYSNDNAIKEVYDLIRTSENANTIAQGLSGVLGFPFTIGVDAGAVAAIYVPMFNKIRKEFNRTSNQSDKVVDMISAIGKEILFDLVVDKVLGNIAIIGIYFNAICARTMTWRLGILFAMLSASGENIQTNRMSEAMELIRKTFPQEKAFSFSRPNYYEFKKMVQKFSSNPTKSFDEIVVQELSDIKMDSF